jgi:hypothetical protein
MKLALNERLENLSRQDHPANLHDIAILSVDIPYRPTERKGSPHFQSLHTTYKVP